MGYGLKAKRVLVTGGTRGIGRATVLAFAEAGAHVVTCHRAEGPEVSRLAGDLAEHGDEHRIIRQDVTDAEGARRLLEVCREHLGGLDVLVNNVGVDGHALLEDLEPAQWHRVMDHNVTSAYLVSRAALPLLADGASIVNVGSAAALRGRPASAHYGASKAAMIGFTRGLCKELGPRQIRVNAVAPGVTSDDPGSDLPPHVLERLLAATALGRLCRPRDVADAVLFLAGDDSRGISGATLTVDGGM
ncbi:SDR family oxidoreductase [Streptomyces ipomoeae]|jgi:3-oxoacyl-[acyl-carrier protein] reductase|uniref:Oxidoreductase, short chain dehydrogenase/reductase family protein n=2 Tax=Streptomyces ipomoeae TaxID=103232 RepID=L1KK12_9ACTN|nr:SDR family NAD(P)-dependent oxidoreductase [Streptomyces ipomoeae]EKX60723.1 oxidoreductase, short chain dehydrogenase/reductase family protein [Streptomyces ipomoeae 91-03]MDX2693210.1 SDR family NAD(P)-dependent oxidoreductase [Streptomyces ipomoeae]MDX2820653.1 SDR family NAD(P)-dependent oxidoreductase [Streptomyces ipomoeae]MDX2838678.1 SDR family NAD(P)-dependent oxidoreductase [Streptomyces ipomoeae]MDX2873161.1 SDR family NAD(P)-dependent oxidoreductase [Streptomyces ipomoeae]